MRHKFEYINVIHKQTHACMEIVEEQLDAIILRLELLYKNMDPIRDIKFIGVEKAIADSISLRNDIRNLSKFYKELSCLADNIIIGLDK